MVALALRSAGEAAAMSGPGFNDDLQAVRDGRDRGLLSKHFEVDDVLSVDGNVLACAAFSGKETARSLFLAPAHVVHDSLEKLASACYEETIFDLSACAAQRQIVRSS